MSTGDEGPPQSISLDLEEALELLAVLEDVRATLRDTDRLSGLIAVEDQVRLVSRRLGFDDPEGGSDAR